MAKKKIYAVRKGKTTGIFYSWDECSASVNGYPGAEYKSFTTKEEANAYLGNSFAVQIEEEKKDQKNTALDGTESTLTAYVDGSFDPSIGKYAFGCILLTPDGEIIRESGNGQDPESLAIREPCMQFSGRSTMVIRHLPYIMIMKESQNGQRETGKQKINVHSSMLSL